MNQKLDGEFASTLLPIDQVLPCFFQSRTETCDIGLDELSKSIEKNGILEPLVVRKTKAGFELVAGDRRLKAAKIAKFRMVPVVVRDVSDEDVIVIQANENLQRNDLSELEKTRLVSEMAKRFKLDAKGISEKLHKSYTWVVTYLPSAFKDKEKAEAGSLGGQAKAATSLVAQSQTVKTQDTIAQTPTMKKVQDEMMQNIIKCQKCGQQVHITKAKNVDDKDLCPTCYVEATRPVHCLGCNLGKPADSFKVWQGHFLCSDCLKETEVNPEKFLHKFPKVELPKLEPKNHKPPIDSWKNREAKMHSTISKMDEAMLVRLQNNKFLREQGWKVEFQKHYVLRQFVSDVSLIHSSKKEIPVCFDGPVHEGREDKDEAVRQEFLKRFRLTAREPLGLPYKDFTLPEQVRLEKQVEEAIKEES